MSQRANLGPVSGLLTVVADPKSKTVSQRPSYQLYPKGNSHTLSRPLTTKGKGIVTLADLARQDQPVVAVMAGADIKDAKAAKAAKADGNAIQSDIKKPSLPVRRTEEEWKALLQRDPTTSVTYFMYPRDMSTNEVIAAEYKTIIKQAPKAVALLPSNAKAILGRLKILFNLANKVSWAYFDKHMQRVFLESFGLNAYEHRKALWPLFYKLQQGGCLTEPVLIEIMQGLMSDKSDAVTREQEEKLVTVLDKINDVSEIVDHYLSNMPRRYGESNFYQQYQKIGNICHALVEAKKLTADGALALLQKLRKIFDHNNSLAGYAIYDVASVLQSCERVKLDIADYQQLIDRVIRIKLANEFAYVGSIVHELCLDGNLTVASLEELLVDFESGKGRKPTPIAKWLPFFATGSAQSSDSKPASVAAVGEKSANPAPLSLSLSQFSTRDQVITTYPVFDNEAAAAAACEDLSKKGGKGLGPA